MRPLTLTVEGLRSFRERVHVDFRDRELLAIVGDTGVGKSSLLEAITYALYSGATWTAHSSDLINDTGRDMLVELTFMSDGKTYTVRRTGSRATRPATAQLTCHEDNRAIDNVRAVNDAIAQLLGLDRDTFLKTVILPQGRFAELLTSTPGERNAVLRNIFRVDVLDQVRDHVKLIRDRVYPHVQGIKQRLAALPPDPANQVKNANARHKDATSLEKRISGALTQAKAITKSINEAAERVLVLEKALADLETQDLTALERELAQLLARSKVLADALSDLEKQEKVSSAKVLHLEKRRSALGADGLDPKALARSQTTLEAIADVLPEIIESVASIRSDAEALTSLEAGAQGLAAEAKKLRNVATTAESAAQDAADAAKAAERGLRDAEAAHERAVEARAERESADAAAVEADGRQSAADERLSKATAARKAADKAHAVAADAYEKLERQHAVAHAAVGARAGDSCPICERSLPQGFKPPKAAAGLEQARTRVREAQKGCQEAGAAFASAGEAVKNAKERFAEEQTRLKRAKGAELSSTDRLKKLLGVDEVDLAAPRERLLAGVIDAHKKAASREAEARAIAEGASKAAHQSAAKEDQHRVSVQAETRRIREMTTVCERRLRGLSRDVASLSDRVRPDLGELTALHEVDVTVLAPTRVSKHMREVQAWLEQFDELDDQLLTARADLDSVRSQIAETKEQVATDVHEPLQEVRAALEGIANNLATAASLVGAAATRVHVRTAGLEKALKEVATERSRLTGAAKADLGLQSETQREAERRLRDLLRTLDVQDVEHLEDQLTRSRVELEEAKRAVVKAQDELALATDLQGKLGIGGQLVDDLDELRKLLSSFISDVLSRQSLALLAVAGQRLAEMTGSRFAFTADFDVLDQLTGQPRHTETLSGGESFLASLALALGMVDLAARAGGRLEALFLDEGFGALDNSNLGAAIDALEATAREGRMVAVVSHVKAVADRIDDVMVVFGKPQGSQVVWLDDSERDGLRDSDVAAALRGLLE
jgi:exonuclease SbcC